ADVDGPRLRLVASGADRPPQPYHGPYRTVRHRHPHRRRLEGGPARRHRYGSWGWLLLRRRADLLAHHARALAGVADDTELPRQRPGPDSVRAAARGSADVRSVGRAVLLWLGADARAVHADDARLADGQPSGSRDDNSSG